MSSKQPLKRKTTTLQTKYEAILEVEKGQKTKSLIAKEIGVPPNTLSTWLSKAESLKKAYETQEFGPKMKRMKKADFQDVDDALDAWMREARARDIPISGPILQAKAQEFAQEFGHPEFQCSNGWLSRFKARKGIGFRAIKGEAKSVKPEAVDAWKKTLLPKLLEEFAPEDIYNADETGLFYQLQPDKSLVYKDEDGRGGKRSKLRVTVLTVANMDGSDKLKPVLINKCRRPHAFSQKRVNVDRLPVDYQWNKNAWMTSALFNSWLYKLDKRFLRKKRKIAMVLDNCTAHPNINSTLKAIRLVFLPPNTTSVTQPMDQGIIASFKCHYRRYFVQHGLLRAMEQGKDFTWTVLDAIYGIKAAWDKVTPATIKHCFRHCGFEVPVAEEEDPDDDVPLNQLLPVPVAEEEDPDDDIPLSQLLEDLRRHMAVTKEQEAAFSTVDDNLLTSAPLTVKDISQDILAAKETEDDEEDEDDEATAAPLEPPPTLAKALESTTTLKDVLSSSNLDTEEMWEHLAALEKFLQKNFQQKAKQTTIMNFFSAPPPPPRTPTVDATELRK